MNNWEPVRVRESPWEPVNNGDKGRPVTRGTVASMDASMRKISIEEEDEAEVQGNASGNRGFSAGNRGFSADGESKADLSHQHSILVSPQAGGDGGRAGGICEACTGRPSTSYRYDMDRYRNSVDLGMSNRDIASFPPPLVTARYFFPDCSRDPGYSTSPGRTKAVPAGDLEDPGFYQRESKTGEVLPSNARVLIATFNVLLTRHHQCSPDSEGHL
ncbi:unnamed protein product [Darwinula stevensoni]|uniref:Uncharacterized protein n=1 Tax=Darwinula stevensoni TaxID=69355 RepID=A0A7R9A8Y4_9CRUS|nr:unnamed protein product [Darwinula stevensoni]CAG0896903.1 unnamed protein product [Darwinula stevensoni]